MDYFTDIGDSTFWTLLPTSHIPILRSVQKGSLPSFISTLKNLKICLDFGVHLMIILPSAVYKFMTTHKRTRIPSIIKKFLMAITGGILTLFVLGHMIGNLQAFASPNKFNIYADTLQNLPYNLLWLVRTILLLATAIHVWMAILITKENRRAHPEDYKIKKRVQATLASKTMGVSGSIILFFIVFHILHFTTHTIYPEFKSTNYYTMIDDKEFYNVYKMMVDSFSITWVSVFYIVAMGLLCMHLSHGVSSMFQSLGLRNEKWRPTFNAFANIYAWVIFLGFIAIPVSVLISKYTSINLLPV